MKIGLHAALVLVGVLYLTESVLGEERQKRDAKIECLDGECRHIKGSRIARAVYDKRDKGGNGNSKGKGQSGNEGHDEQQAKAGTGSGSADQKSSGSGSKTTTTTITTRGTEGAVQGGGVVATTASCPYPDAPSGCADCSIQQFCNVPTGPWTSPCPTMQLCSVSLNGCYPTAQVPECPSG